jgi:hypothetical protein
VSPAGVGALGGQRRTPGSAAHLDALRDAVRGALGLEPDTVVLVQELACSEPGCPPVETVVAVLDPAESRRVWSLPLPRAEVAVETLRALVAHHPEGTRHEH